MITFRNPKRGERERRPSKKEGVLGIEPFRNIIKYLPVLFPLNHLVKEHRRGEGKYSRGENFLFLSRRPEELKSRSFFDGTVGVGGGVKSRRAHYRYGNRWIPQDQGS